MHESPPPEREQMDWLIHRVDVLEQALRKIAEEGECSISMVGGCVGAVHSRRKRYDNPERVDRVGCAKHYAEKVLADLRDADGQPGR